MSLIYLASPYSHPDLLIRIERFEKACICAAKLMAKGLHIFAPTCHTHPIALHGALPTGWEYWEDLDTKMLSICNEMWILNIEGWKESVGVINEIKIMQKINKLIGFCDQNGEFLAYSLNPQGEIF